MKFLTIMATIFFALSAMASEKTLKATPYEYVKTSIGKGKPYFLEVGSTSCKSCKVMGEELYELTQKRPNYEIHFINVRMDRKVANALSVRMIPTQIIFDKDGKEVYRHVGMIHGEELLKLFKTYKFD